MNLDDPVITITILLLLIALQFVTIFMLAAVLVRTHNRLRRYESSYKSGLADVCDDEELEMLRKMAGIDGGRHS